MSFTKSITKVGLITPAYNNAEFLLRLYESLERSKCKQFIWVIINDGSTDNTIEIMAKIKERASFEVRTISRENGGKCRALNQAFRENTDFDFYMVIDSDEIILPDAVGKLRKKVDQYIGDESIGAIYFWRDMKNDPVIRSKLLHRPRGDRLLTIYERKTKGKMFGDGAIGYYKHFLERYQFREFQGENFIGEITILQEAAICGYAQRIVFVDIILSIGEYSKKGLSAQGRTLRINNPYGMIYYSGMMQSELISDRKIRCKYAICAQAYASIAKISRKDLTISNIHPQYLKAWAKLPGYLLGIYWKKRYKK